MNGFANDRVAQPGAKTLMRHRQQVGAIFRRAIALARSLAWRHLLHAGHIVEPHHVAPEPTHLLRFFGEDRRGVIFVVNDSWRQNDDQFRPVLTLSSEAEKRAD